jgi:hypothetical protein
MLKCLAPLGLKEPLPCTFVGRCLLADEAPHGGLRDHGDTAQDGVTLGRYLAARSSRYTMGLAAFRPILLPG